MHDHLTGRLNICFIVSIPLLLSIDLLISSSLMSFSDILLQKAILLVCKSLSVSRKWRQLFYQLNSESDVTEEANEIEAVHVKETTCCRLALCRWKDRTERASVWTLVDALRAIRCNVVAGILINSMNFNNVHSTHRKQTHIHPLTHTCPRTHKS